MGRKGSGEKAQSLDPRKEGRRGGERQGAGDRNGDKEQ